MIKVNLYAVGKVKEDYFAKGIAEYLKRLKKYCDFNIIEIKEQPLKSESESEKERALLSEGEGIIRAVKGEYYVFAIEGEKFSSEDLAEFISKKIDRGSDLNFVIGSSHGLSNTVKKGAKGAVSLSLATFPHTLFRLMACEQIYRAFTILNGATYHK